jgi:hypothetical protein
LYFFLLLFVLGAQAADLPSAKTIDPKSFNLRAVADSAGWHRLLHYRRSFPFFRLKAQADGEGFYFSPQGRVDPYQELLATLAAFNTDTPTGQNKQAPLCAFPARARFLAKELNIRFPDYQCEKLEAFLQKFKSPTGVTLVFSSAFPNNPASMFGHSFLRINAKAPVGTKKIDLLDQGLSFAAMVPPDENSFAFMYFGLTGGYNGQWSLLPYYAKVNEYTNGESRDLWEYELNLNAQETEFLLLHVWELEMSTYFEYFFFDENCSFLLLKAVEVAKPEWDFGDFPLFAIPGETMRRVAAVPGAIRNVQFRPALRKQVLQKWSVLTKPERTEFWDLLAGKAKVEDSANPFLLQTLGQYLQYTKQRKSALTDAQSELMSQALLRRSQLGAVAERDMPPIAETTRPDLGHAPSAIGAGIGYDQSEYGEINFKFAYHDLMNFDQGFTPYSHIDFPGFELRYYSGAHRDVILQRLHLLNITSLAPVSSLETPLSWRFGSQVYVPPDLVCRNCHAAHLSGGAGLTLGFAGERGVLYGLFGAYVEGSRRFGSLLRGGPEGRVALIYSAIPRWKSRLSLHAVSDLWQDRRQKMFWLGELEQAWDFSQKVDLRLSWRRLQRGSVEGKNASDGKIVLNYFY